MWDDTPYGEQNVKRRFVGYTVLYLFVGWSAGSVGSAANGITAWFISWCGLGYYLGVAEITMSAVRPKVKE